MKKARLYLFPAIIVLFLWLSDRQTLIAWDWGCMNTDFQHTYCESDEQLQIGCSPMTFEECVDFIWGFHGDDTCSNQSNAIEGEYDPDISNMGYEYYFWFQGGVQFVEPYIHCGRLIIEGRTSGSAVP